MNIPWLDAMKAKNEDLVHGRTYVQTSLVLLEQSLTVIR